MYDYFFVFCFFFLLMYLCECIKCEQIKAFSSSVIEHTIIICTFDAEKKINAENSSASTYDGTTSHQFILRNNRTQCPIQNIIVASVSILLLCKIHYYRLVVQRISIYFFVEFIVAEIEKILRWQMIKSFD